MIAFASPVLFCFFHLLPLICHLLNNYLHLYVCLILTPKFSCFYSSLHIPLILLRERVSDYVVLSCPPWSTHNRYVWRIAVLPQGDHQFCTLPCHCFPEKPLEFVVPQMPSTLISSGHQYSQTSKACKFPCIKIRDVKLRGWSLYKTCLAGVIAQSVYEAHQIPCPYPWREAAEDNAQHCSGHIPIYGNAGFIHNRLQWVLGRPNKKCGSIEYPSRVKDCFLISLETVFGGYTFGKQ